MDVVFALLVFITFIGFIIGMIRPKTLGMSGRIKVVLFMLLPCNIFFFLWGYYGSTKNDAAKKDPENATEVSYYMDKLTAVPKELKKFKKLKKLILKKNEIEVLDSTILLSLNTLEELDISQNPIKEVPDWVASMPNLKKLNLNETQITDIPSGVKERVKEISYEDTPLDEKLKDLANASEKKENNEEDEGGDGTESFGEFAWRKLSGKEYGHSVDFGNDKVFYIKPVTEEQATKLGEYLKEMNFFNEDNEVAVQLLYDTKESKYDVKFVVDESKLTDEVRSGFKVFRMMIQSSVLDGVTTHLHLCDGRLKTIEVFTSDN